MGVVVSITWVLALTIGSSESAKDRRCHRSKRVDEDEESAILLDNGARTGRREKKRLDGVQLLLSGGQVAITKWYRLTVSLRNDRIWNGNCLHFGEHSFTS